MSLKLILIGLCLAGSASDAGSKAKASSASAVQAVLAELRDAEGVRAEISKVVEQKVLERTVKSEGLFYFSKGRMRLEIREPEKSLLVFDGQYIWLESEFDEDTKQVTKIYAGNLKRSDSLMASLFERKDVLKNFEFVKKTSSSGEDRYEFIPKNPKKMEVKTLVIGVKNSRLSRVAYTDQIDNEVSYAFESISKRKLYTGLFLYKPPKNALVSEVR